MSRHHHADCKSALLSAQTHCSSLGKPPYAPVRRSSKTGGGSAYDRIIRHLGWARQATGLRWFARRISHVRNDFSPLINDLWPRLEDHKYRWELHSYGLPEGYDKLVTADIIILLIEALKGIGAADNKLLEAHAKADHHNPTSPDPA